MAPKTLDQHIELTPGVCGGKPRVAGRRITVQNIVIWHELMGKGVDEIACEYDLNLADVHAALAYYHDHRQDMDNNMKASAAWISDLKQETPSIVAAKLKQGS